VDSCSGVIKEEGALYCDGGKEKTSSIRKANTKKKSDALDVGDIHHSLD